MATVDYNYIAANVTNGVDPNAQTLSINPVTMTPGTGDQYSDIGEATYNLSHVYDQAGTYVCLRQNHERLGRGWHFELHRQRGRPLPRR